MNTTLTNLMDGMDIDRPELIKLQKLRSMLGAVMFTLGTISLDTDELSAGEEWFNRALDIISFDLQSPDNIIISISAKNQLALIWAQRTETENAKEELEDAERLYEAYISRETYIEPVSIHQHFQCLKDEDLPPDKELEKLLTLTKFYLAQVYGQLKDPIKSAVYCHETLKRQIDSKDYDPIDWALNAATLSQFFVVRNSFNQARHHLAGASYVLDKYEDKLKHKELTEEELEAKKEELKHRSADVSRCWGKYGINLLGYSKKPEQQEVNEQLQNLYFAKLELESFENQITDQPVEVFEDARELFLVTQKFLNHSKEYYSLENHASSFVEIAEDHSQLFYNLIQFESDDDRICKMHKKRIDILKHVLDELNSQYYLHACRKLWFSLGEIHHDIMTIKLKKIQNKTDMQNPQTVQKINRLINDSLKYFLLYINSMGDKRTKEIAEPLPDDSVRPVLLAHMFIGRLHIKKINPDKEQELLANETGLKYYQYLVDYCGRHPDAKPLVEEEFRACQEMVELLSLKMLRISGSNVL